MRMTTPNEGFRRLIIPSLNGQTARARPKHHSTPRLHPEHSGGLKVDRVCCTFHVEDIVHCAVRDAGGAIAAACEKAPRRLTLLSELRNGGRHYPMIDETKLG